MRRENSFKLPFEVNGYLFYELINHGAFSQIYLCRSHKHSDPVVAKVVSTCSENVENCLKVVFNELTALKSLNFPHIVIIYDFFRYENDFVLILKHYPGGSLDKRISEVTKIQKPEAILVLYQVLLALSFARSKGYAHMDIKPANILIDENGRAVLADFGFSIKGEKKTDNPFCGSFLYKSPEILQYKEYSPYSSDMWSFGVLAAYLIQGRLPWVSRKPEGLTQEIISGNYKIDANIDPELKSFIQSLLCLDPKERPSPAELLKSSIFRTCKSDLTSWINRKKTKPTKPIPIHSFRTSLILPTISTVLNSKKRLNKTRSFSNNIEIPMNSFAETI